jgi:hypothetical protein
LVFIYFKKKERKFLNEFLWSRARNNKIK